MTVDDDVTRFQALYRGVYVRAVRRLDDPRHRLPPETVALLGHLAQAGPLTLTEMTHHLGRAPATLSAKVDSLQAQGLLDRQRDLDDGRRSLVWLTPSGRAALDQAQQVLAPERLRTALAALDDDARAALLTGLDALVRALDTTDHPEDQPT